MLPFIMPIIPLADPPKLEQLRDIRQSMTPRKIRSEFQIFTNYFGFLMVRIMLEFIAHYFVFHSYYCFLARSASSSTQSRIAITVEVEVGSVGGSGRLPSGLNLL